MAIIVAFSKIMPDWEVIKDPKTGIHKLSALGIPPEIEAALNHHIQDSGFFGGKFNTSLTLCTGVGEGGECLDGLSTGSVDVLLQGMPIIQTLSLANNTFPLQIIHQDYVQFISSYDCSKEKSVAESRQLDFIESILGFDLLTWFICCLFFFTFVKLLRKHLESNQISGQCNPVWTVVTFVLKHGIMNEINWVSRFLILVISMFMFFVGSCYFENCIKSDKVTVYSPFVFRTYADVIGDPDVEILFKKWEPIKDHFKHAPVDTDFGKIYQEAMRKNLQNGVEALDMYGRLTSKPVGKQLFIGNGDDVKNTQRICCFSLLSSESIDRICYFRSWDELSPISSIDAFFASDRFKEKESYSRYGGLLRRMLEMGILKKSRDSINAGMDTLTPNIEMCARDTRFPITHEPDNEPLDITNYKYAMGSLILPFVIAIVGLFDEMIKLRARKESKVNIFNVKRKSPLQVSTNDTCSP